MNIVGTALENCSLDPLTGFFRDGCCDTCADDLGEHTICVEVTAEFLTFSRERGNDLIAPRLEVGFPGLLPQDRWCLCLGRWLEAYHEGVAPQVLPRATHESVIERVPLATIELFVMPDA